MNVDQYDSKVVSTSVLDPIRDSGWVEILDIPRSKDLSYVFGRYIRVFRSAYNNIALLGHYHERVYLFRNFETYSLFAQQFLYSDAHGYEHDFLLDPSLFKSRTPSAPKAIADLLDLDLSLLDYSLGSFRAIGRAIDMNPGSNNGAWTDDGVDMRIAILMYYSEAIRLATGKGPIFHRKEFHSHYSIAPYESNFKSYDWFTNYLSESIDFKYSYEALLPSIFEQVTSL